MATGDVIYLSYFKSTCISNVYANDGISIQLFVRVDYMKLIHKLLTIIGSIGVITLTLTMFGLTFNNTNIFIIGVIGQSISILLMLLWFELSARNYDK